MSELKKSDFKIGQQIGVIWRMRFENGTKFYFKRAKISRLNTTSRGTTIYVTPKLFCVNYKIEDEEFEDYRTIPKDGLLMVGTPMLITDETAEYFEKVVEAWNNNPPKSIFE